MLTSQTLSPGYTDSMQIELSTLYWLNDYLNQGILVIDQNMTILTWSRWLELHSDFTSDEMVGKHLLDVLPDLATRHMDRLFHQALDGQVVMMSQRFHRYLIPMPPDDSQLGLAYMPQSARIAPLFDGDQVIGAIALIEDVTDRVYQEKELGQRIATQQALQEVDQAILTLDLASSLEHVVARAAALTHSSLSAVLLYNENGALELAAHVLPTPEHVLTQHDVDDSMAAWVAETGQALAVTDLQKPLTDQAILHPLVPDHRSALAVPLQIEERILGVLVVESPLTDAFGDRAHSLLLALATQAAIAIRNANLYDEIQRYAHTLEEQVMARTATLNRVNDQLQAALVYKNEFVANASHELRTPLTNIRLMLYLLRQAKAAGQDPAKQERYLATIDRESELLQHMLEELFYLSQMDLESARYEPTLVDVGRILRTLLADREEMIAQAGLSLNTTLPNVPLTAYADEHMMIQLFSNLLNNAINYNRPQGEIHVHADRVTDGDLTWTEISFTDTGFGIEPNETRRIFERFFRGNASVRSGSPGAGLGLAICQEIITKHNGHISLESQQDQGTRFTVRLPLPPFPPTLRA